MLQKQCHHDVEERAFKDMVLLYLFDYKTGYFSLQKQPQKSRSIFSGDWLHFQGKQLCSFFAFLLNVGSTLLGRILFSEQNLLKEGPDSGNTLLPGGKQLCSFFAFLFLFSVGSALLGKTSVL